MRWPCAALVVVAVAALSTPARAGTYDVWSCAGPDRAPLPATGWVPESQFGSVRSTCGMAGGAFAGSLNTDGIPSGGFARWTFVAPPDTTIAGVTIQRAANSSGTFQSGRGYFLFRDSPVLQPGYGLDACIQFTSPCVRPGDPAEPWSEASRYSSGAIQAGRLIASAQCDGPSPCPAAPDAARGAFQIYRARITVADAFPPAFRVPPSGSLLDGGGPVSGTRSVSFDGRDLGGGIRAAEIVIDGQPVAREDVAAGGRCREPFNDPVPCPGTAAGTIALETAGLDNGIRRAQVALVDVAGNRSLSDPVTIRVHNDKLPNGVGASRTAKLSAAFRVFGGRRRHVRVVGHRARAVVSGRLVDGKGSPIARANVTVHARLDHLGARERPVATIRTGAGGRFRWRAPSGPSRFFRVAYRDLRERRA